uniref:Uncharacterized protein n=2 Tax=Rhizophagus irregularis TaxID=588596 RepID=U9TBC4_RHIID
MGCIIGSTFSNNETNINTYDDISITINKIKENNAVAKYVRAYILQVPSPKFSSVIISLLLNLRSDKTKLILDIQLHIILIGSNSTQVEFNTQTQVQQISTSSRLRISYIPYNIDFNCPIFLSVLTLNRSTVGFKHFAKLLTHSESPMYKSDIYKFDRQDDGAAYQIFCPKNLMCCLDSNNKIKSEFEETFIYLFIIVDSYLNQNITPIERIRMNFIALQIFAILTLIVLLVKAHRDFYNQYPLVPWIHGLEMYQFKYNQNFIKNDQIHYIFDQSRQIACNLAKYLEMLISNIVLINSFWPYVLINSNDMEISDSNDENMQDSENSNENLSNSSLSQTISHAAKKVDLLKQKENKRNEMDIDEESRNLSLNECRK